MSLRIRLYDVRWDLRTGMWVELRIVALDPDGAVAHAAKTIAKQFKGRPKLLFCTDVTEKVKEDQG